MGRTNLAHLTRDTPIAKPPPQPASPSLPAGPARERRQIAVYLPVPVHRQLRKLALEEERSMQSYLHEGLDMVFKGHGSPESADLTKENA